MPVFRLTEELIFPPATGSDENGLVAVGGDLRPERLLLAYSEGIFPWYSEGMPIMWHSPDPRMVLDPSRVHIPKSLKKTIRKGRFEFRMDTNFEEVIEHCALASRPDQDGTWITEEMEAAYTTLFYMGYAHSAEAWVEGKLVGGLYGVSLGSAFFGESMFTLEPDASKFAFVGLIKTLYSWGFSLVDCQVHTEHLERFGAEMWSRKKFLAELQKALQITTKRGKWCVPHGV